MTDFADLDAVARALAEIALAAGPSVMEEYAKAGAAREKADGSPVTAADERAEAILLERLAAFAPGVAVVAEEACAAGAALVSPRRFFLVDPLDGTREFLARNGEFTVNIGLIEDGRPVAGAVYAPALGEVWFGGVRAFSAEARLGRPLSDEQTPLAVRPASARLAALASRSHSDAATEAFLTRLNVAERLSAGSSLKFCRVAEGVADIYPRFGPTMEWDTAAADAVLRAAGGMTLGLDGRPLRYGKLDLGLRNAGFLALGDVGLTSRCVNALSGISGEIPPP
jgi:3'(2'),5'-bisphosphate nucleotidase